MTNYLPKAGLTDSSRPATRMYLRPQGYRKPPLPRPGESSRRDRPPPGRSLLPNSGPGSSGVRAVSEGCRGSNRGRRHAPRETPFAGRYERPSVRLLARGERAPSSSTSTARCCARRPGQVLSRALVEEGVPAGGAGRCPGTRLLYAVNDRLGENLVSMGLVRAAARGGPAAGARTRCRRRGGTGRGRAERAGGPLRPPAPAPPSAPRAT